MKYLYLCVSGEWLKFGITHDIKSRKATYKTHNPNAFFSLVWEGNEIEIKEAEATIHKTFKHKDGGTDWIKCRENDNHIEKIVEVLSNKFKKVDKIDVKSNKKKPKITTCRWRFDTHLQYLLCPAGNRLKKMAKKVQKIEEMEARHKKVMANFD